MNILNHSFNEHLSSYVAVVGLALLAVVALRYYREGDTVFWDASTYFMLLTCLYVCVPGYVHLETGISLVNASYETIQFSAKYSLYFAGVLVVYYFVKALTSRSRRAFRSQELKRNLTLVPIGNHVMYILWIIITVYILSVFLLKCPGIRELWADRPLASHFRTSLNETYKIQLMFAVTVTVVVYLAIKNRSSRYIVLFCPFLAIDVLTTDRSFLYQALIASVGVMLYTGRRIPVFKLALLAFIVVSMEVVRTSWQTGFDMSELLFIPGELLLTTEVNYLMIESSLSVDLTERLLYALGKVLSPQAISLFFTEEQRFVDIIATESPISTGLGGSLLSEVFSSKNYLFHVLYPFVVIVYLELINLVRARAGYFGALVFVFYLTSTYAVFRNGVVFIAMEPIYYAIYAGSWYWLIGHCFNNRARRHYYVTAARP